MKSRVLNHLQGDKATAASGQEVHSHHLCAIEVGKDPHQTEKKRTLPNLPTRELWADQFTVILFLFLTLFLRTYL